MGGSEEEEWSVKVCDVMIFQVKEDKNLDCCPGNRGCDKMLSSQRFEFLGLSHEFEEQLGQ